MSAQDRKAVRVTIFGEDYQIRTDLGEEYTRECARYVDDAIQAAHIGGHITEPHKAAILAAMKITDELFRARAEAAGLDQKVRERLAEVTARLEGALKS
jgi:cell division protein ZapA